MRSHSAICFAVGVWRDHTEWCASCFNVGKSREITPSGVLAVLMAESPEIVVLAVSLMESNEISQCHLFCCWSLERSHQVVC
jgi:hypothetical protein